METVIARFPGRISFIHQVIAPDDLTLVPPDYQHQHLENLCDCFFVDFSYTHFYQPTQNRNSRIPLVTFTESFMVRCDTVSFCHQLNNISFLFDIFCSVPLPSNTLEAVLERVVACGVDMLARNNVNSEIEPRTLRSIYVDVQGTTVPMSEEEESGGDQLAHETVTASLNSLMRVSVDDDPGCASETCSICLEIFEESTRKDRMIVRMPCSHVFHEDCILRWLSLNSSCPYCRQLP